jgi:hypothetical protein
LAGCHVTHYFIADTDWRVEIPEAGMTELAKRFAPSPDKFHTVTVGIQALLVSYADAADKSAEMTPFSPKNKIPCVGVHKGNRLAGVVVEFLKKYLEYVDRNVVLDPYRISDRSAVSRHEIGPLGPYAICGFLVRRPLAAAKSTVSLFEARESLPLCSEYLHTQSGRNNCVLVRRKPFPRRTAGTRMRLGQTITLHE